MEQIKLIPGGIAIDDRGSVSFVNDFDFKGVKRFYAVDNHRQGFVRAWHGHKKEGKYALVTSGAALVGAVKIDNWDQPSPGLVPEKIVLSAAKPGLLYIPAGFANGFMSLSPDTKILFFSTSTLEDSKDDDFRYPARLWDIWSVEER